MVRRAVIVMLTLAGFGGLALATQALRAQDLPPTMDAPSAAGLPAAGGLLVDIRTPKEQRESGTPKGAVEVPLQDDSLSFRQSFIDDVLAAAGGDHDRPVAVIDADGRRSAFAARLLESRGFTRVFSVGEGLFGSNLGPGWVARGLPVEPCPAC